MILIGGGAESNKSVQVVHTIVHTLHKLIKIKINTFWVIISDTLNSIYCIFFAERHPGMLEHLLLHN